MKVPARQITMETAAALASAGAASLSAGDPVFDFCDVERADSSAVALMLGWMRKARTLGLECAFENIPPGLQSLLALYGVEPLLHPHHRHS